MTISDVYVPTGATGYVYNYIVKDRAAVGREKERRRRQRIWKKRKEKVEGLGRGIRKREKVEGEERGRR